MTINDGLNIKEGGIRSFLLIGQSNMAGRGNVSDVPPIVNPDCFMLRMGRWQKMSEPINPDRAVGAGDFKSGICLGASFADEVARAVGGRVGLIPCADGGTRIEQWMPGELLYDHAVMMTRLAMRTSTLAGILWHQGCSDCGSDESLNAHGAMFMEMITSLRRDLDAENIPLVVGELPRDPGERWNLGNRTLLMNARYHELIKELPLCGIATSEELKLKDDGIHFDARSLRTFGVRYFEVWRSLVQK